ncbi:MAG: hypothetical protein EOO51_00125 [Flavobacterium sp.]|nr:MAG: hypothetical protein EOO51_00125 [Flavobacterium sp.]
MCTITDNLKFCTCQISDDTTTGNIWRLYRFNKKKNLQCMGEPQIPPQWLEPDYEANQQKIAARLNGPDAFDVPIEFKEKDIFEMWVTGETDAIVYSFRFLKNKWQAHESRPFELMSRYDEIREGEVRAGHR